ncbi:ABC transporter substrate-binding protein [Embleya sp. NPDC001921]
MTAATALVAGCGSGGEEKRAAGGPPRSGGSIVMDTLQDAATLDPFTALKSAVADSPRLDALYDGLVYIDAKSGTMRPQLAESVAMTPGNPSEWTVKVRPGVTFTDGSAFDAEAVKFSWQTQADPAVRSYRMLAASGLTLTVADPLTLTVTLPAPNTFFDRVIAQELNWIVSPTAYRADPKGFGAKPVGAGPFKLRKWVRGSRMTMVKNPTYWGGPARPYLDSITFDVVAEESQQLANVVSGRAQLLNSSNGANIERARTEKLEVDEVVSGGGQFVTFNTTRPPFDDPRARRAVALALDPADMAKTLRNGYVPALGLSPSQSPFVSPGADQPGPDKAEAQRLFDQLAAEGKPMNFGYLVPQARSSMQVAEYFQSRLNQFRGVRMTIESLDYSAYATRYGIQRDFQATLSQQWWAHPEPNLHNLVHSQSPQNYAGLRSPEIDAALTRARTSQDEDVRRQAYTEVQRILSRELPYWVYAQATVAVIASSKVTGVVQVNDGTYLPGELALTG